jgi:hypothetical protein
MKPIFITTLIAVIFYFLIVVPFHYVTSQGEHTGFVTATQTSGLFFKTHSAYLKTDTQSSQEDHYCVVGEDVFKKLQEMQTSKEKVTVEYVEWFSRGIKECGEEMAGVIVGVK